MTVTIVYADSTDGYVVSSNNASYTTARAGSVLSVFDGAANLIYGQSFSAGYDCHEAFARWPYVAPSGEVVTGAAFRLYHNTVNGPAVPRDLEIREYAYASPLTTAAWRPGANLAGLPLLATVQGVNGGNGKFALVGSAALMNKIAAGSATISTVMHSSRLRTGTAPTGFEQNYITASEGAGTTNDPALVFTSTARSTLFGIMAGSVRLSDGSWALLESDGAATPVITLRRHTGAAVTTVATIPAASYATPLGAQGLALVVDAADNLYLIGRATGTDNSLAVMKYAKGSGWTWTAGTPVTSALPAYAAQINQVAATWHGSSILAVVGHAPGSGISGAAGADVSYAVLSPATLDAQSTAAAPGAVLPQPTASIYFSSFANETGSGLDVAASTAGAAAGYVVTAGKDGAPGDQVAVGVGRYEVDASAVTGAAYSTASSSYARKDASAKVRVVPTGTSTLAVVTVDPDSGWGITVVPYQATPSGWTALSMPVTLDSQGLASMPAASALAGSLAWDVIYLPRDNKLWIYYPDATDPRIVRRTGVNLTTYQATGEQVTVVTAGAAGGTNLGLRVARNASVTAGALLTIAHKASGGTLSTVYSLDAYNVAPTEPTLTARAGFDATAAATFAWTFNDPNLPADGQTAYQLQVVNASTLASVVDTGKVTSTTPSRSVAGGTLANDTSYQWRVRTYDQGDLVSPWSTYGLFSTGAGGSVAITDPATDNPAGVITDDIIVTWTVTGSVPVKRRTTLTRNDTGALLGDTGWQADTRTTGQSGITGMVSDVEHTIAVQVENGSGVRSAVGSRKVTPSYGTPDKPSVELEAITESGYVLVSATNPTPTGDRPAPTVNRVWRRVAGSGEDYVMIGQAAVGAEYRDYTASAGVGYEYKVEAVAP